MVKNEKINEKKIEMSIIKLKSIFLFKISPAPKTLAPNKAGIDKKNDIFAESTLLKPNILLAVITIPDLVTPGMRAKT